MMRIGVDVGGTNTDAVLLEMKGQTAKIIKQIKRPTSADVTEGVVNCLKHVLFNCDPKKIQMVNIGTTHLVNAILQRKGLAKTAVIRLGWPSGQVIPSFTDWPKPLASAIECSTIIAKGGYNYDGTVITELDRQEIENFVQTACNKGVKHFAVIGVFSPVKSDQEKTVKTWIECISSTASVTLIHTVGELGILERENATILNESLKPLCSKTVHALVRSIQNSGLNCPLFLTQNDGTIIEASNSVEFPVTLLNSGPTNSMRGAAFLTGFDNAIVADIGGTTTDVGLLVNNFPKLSSTRCKLGGVTFNYKMPEVLSVALGGGTLVVKNDADIVIGPESVGYRLTQDALAFGGKKTTLTDIAVRKHILKDIGDPKLLQLLPDQLVQQVYDKIVVILNECVENARVSKEKIPLILVGGGSIIFNNLKQLGDLNVIIPQSFGVVNAVGAALSQISGTYESIEHMNNDNRDRIIGNAKLQAIEAAVAKGARRDLTDVVELQEIQMQYIPGGAARLYIKAIGEMDSDVVATCKGLNEAIQEELEETTEELAEPKEESDSISTTKRCMRNIDAEGVWTVSRYDVSCIATGAGILGCGGGGNPYVGKLMLTHLIDGGESVKIVSSDYMTKHFDPNDVVVNSAFMGSPTILIEKLPAGTETHSAMKMLAQVGGLTDRNPADRIIEVKAAELQDAKGYPPKQNIVGIVALEIGGMNSTEPLMTGLRMQMPVVDADGMGRAFPELQMVLPLIEGLPPTPAAIGNEFGEGKLVMTCKDAKALEDEFRKTCMEYGCLCGASLGPIPVKELQTKMICGSYSKAWKIGDKIFECREKKLDIAEEICKLIEGKLLLNGKITDVRRQTTGGFARGEVHIVSSDGRESMEIVFQNEYLIAKRINVASQEVQVEVTTPDIIAILERDSGHPIMTEELKYGLYVRIIAAKSAKEFQTTKALKVVGPEAFGFTDLSYTELKT